MAQFVGLNNRDLLLKMKSDAESSIRQKFEEYNKSIDEMLAQSKPNAMGVLQGGSAFFYSLIKGAIDSAADFAAFAAHIGNNFVNDVKHMYDNEDGTSWKTDLKYAFGNLGITFGESIINSTLSAVESVARIPSVFGIDMSETFNKINFQTDMAANFANYFRTNILKNEKIELPFGVKASGSDFAEFSTKMANYGRTNNTDDIDKRFYDETKKFSDKITNVQEWTTKNISEPVADFSTYNRKDDADLKFSDNDWYQMMNGVGESVGKIAASWGMSKLSAKLGMNAKAVGSTYFAASIYGKSFKEAIDNGASMQDSHTYATGIALTETILENLGGTTPSGIQNSAKKNIIDRIIKNEKISNIIKNMIEEGFEEIGSEMVQSKLSFYNNKENKMETVGNEEFFRKVGFSFISGAMSSFALGAANQLYVDLTLESKATKVADNLEKAVNSENPEKALKSFKKDFNSFVQLLNNKNAIGRRGKEGSEYTGKLKTEDKIKLLRETRFDRFVRYNETNDTFELTKDAKSILTDENGSPLDMFKNKITEVTSENTVSEKRIEKGEYAVTDQTLGTDINAKGEVKVVKTAELNEDGKRALKILNDMNIVGAVAESDTQDIGFYGKDNEMIYINQNALKNKSDDYIRLEIIKHEITHHIANTDSKGFANFQNNINKEVALTINKESGEIGVQYKNAAIKEALESSGFQSKMQSIFNGFFQKNKDVQKSLELTNEELVAYFVEETLKGGKFVDILSKTRNGNIFKALSELFQKKESGLDSIFENDKNSKKTLLKLRKQFEGLVKQSTERETNLNFFVEGFIGKANMYRYLFRQEILNKFEEDYILDALSTALENKLPYVVLDGKKYALAEVLDTNTPKIYNKKISAPDFNAIYDGFKYDKANGKDYIKVARKFMKHHNSLTIEEQGHPVQRERYMYAENMLEKLKADINTDLLKQEIDLLNLLYAQEEFSKLEVKYKQQNTVFVPSDEMILIKNGIQKIVKYLNTKTGFTGAKNYVNSKEFPLSALLEIEIVDLKNAKKEVDQVIETLQLIIDIKYPGQYTVDGDISEDKKYGQYSIMMNEEYIDAKKEELQKAKEKDAESDNETVDEIEDKNVYAALEKNNAEITKKTLEIGKKFLQDNGIDIDNVQTFTIDEHTDLDAFFEQNQFDNKDAYVFYSGNFIKKDLTDLVEKSNNKNITLVVILPATWHNDVVKHRLFDSNRKLVLSKVLEKQSKLYTEGMRKQPIKTVLQIWTNKDNKDFSALKDLRVTKRVDSYHSDFDIAILNGTKNRFDLHEETVFDFAVERFGNGVDFSKKYTKLSQLDQNKQYFLIRAKNQDVLNILQSIDYVKLSKIGAVNRDGFSASDLVEAYKERQKEIEDFQEENVMFKKDFGLSYQDTDGNLLTDDQILYFKDSKIKTSDNKLILVHHGTTAKIEKFEHSFITDFNAYGPGFYFTNNMNYARQYSRDDDGIYSGYLNITNPLKTSSYLLTKEDIIALVEKTDPDKKHYTFFKEGTFDEFLSRMFSGRTNPMEFDFNDVEIIDSIFSGFDYGNASFTQGEKFRFLLETLYKETGYDGILVESPFEDNKEKKIYSTFFAVSFFSEQFKTQSNKKPTSDERIMFKKDLGLEWFDQFDNENSILTPADKKLLKIQLLELTEEEKQKVVFYDSEYNLLTNNQRKYFNDTVVKNENNQLILVHHGTTKNFDAFDYDRIGKNGTLYGRGFYFAVQKSRSSVYGDKIISGYLNIKKPILVGGLYKGETAFTKQEMYDIVKKIDPYKYVIDHKRKDEYDDSYLSYDFTQQHDTEKMSYDEFIDTFIEYSSKRYDALAFIQQIEVLSEGTFDNPQITEKMLRAVYDVTGYDGFYAKETSKGQDDSVYVAFFKEQFKKMENKTPSIDPRFMFKRAGYDVKLTPAEKKKISEFDNNFNPLTSSQRKYFANSITKDINNSLQNVFHGTRRDFDEFSYGTIGKNGTMLWRGFYFATNRNRTEPYGDIILDGYLNITKGIDANAKNVLTKDELYKIIKLYDKDNDRFMFEFYPKVSDELPYEQKRNALIENSFTAAKDERWGTLQLLEELHYYSRGMTYDKEGKLTEDFLRAIYNATGYDGVYAEDGNSHMVYVAFFKEQFKLRSNLNPTKSPKIMFKTDGVTQMTQEEIDETEKALKGYVVDGKKAAFSKTRINGLISESIAQHHEDYARAYVTRISPEDFIKLSSPDYLVERLKKEAGPLDIQRLQNERQHMFLSVDFKKGEIVGHEGRHRMIALQNYGIEQVDIVIYPSYDSYDKFNAKAFYGENVLKSQDFRDSSRKQVVLKDIIPVSQRYKDIFVREFSNDKAKVMFKTTKTTELSDEDKLLIVKAFGNDVLSEFFELDKTGNFVVKNSRIKSTGLLKQEIQLKPWNTTQITKFNSNEYAIRTAFDLSKVVIPASDVPVKITDLDATEKMIYEFLKTTKTNFVLYRNTDKAYGYTNENYHGMTFINLNYMKNNQNHVFGTLIHETMHQMFYRNKLDIIGLGKLFSTLLFEIDANGKLTPTKIYKYIDDRKGNFIAYLKSAYKNISAYKNMDTIEDMNRMLSNPTSSQINTKDDNNAINELIAQITGFIFSDTTIYRSILEGKSQNVIGIEQLYTQIMNDASVNSNLKDYYRIVTQQYALEVDKYNKQMKSMFPESEKYTNAELNKFISDFTSGQFTTKGKLVDEYLKERASKKKGDATIAINNILFIASLFSSTAKGGVEIYKKIEEEFSNFKGAIEYILESDDIFEVADNALVKTFKQIKSDFKKSFELVKNTDPSSLYKFVFNFDVNDIDDMAMLIIDFVDSYNEMNDRVIKLLGLPSKESIEDLCNGFINSLDNLKKAHTSKTRTYVEVLNALNDLTAEFDVLKNGIKPIFALKEFNNSTLGKIKEQRIKARKTSMENFVEVLKNRFANYINKMQSNPRQKESPFSKEIKQVIHVIENIIKSVEQNAFNFEMMQNQIMPLLSVLRESIMRSEHLQKKKDNLIKRNATQEEIDAVVEEIMERIDSNLLKVVSNLAILFEKNQNGGLTLIKSMFPQEQMNFVKEFNEKAVASGLIGIMQILEQDYKTSFGDGTFSHDEYAVKTTKQVQNMKGKFDLSFANSTRGVITPQDMFGLFKDLFGDQVDFFNDFYNGYITSANRRAKIQHEFDVSYLDWKKRHDTLQKHSLEKVKVSHDFLIGVRSEKINQMKAEIDNEIKSIRDKSIELRDEKQKITKEKKIILVEIKRLETQLKQYAKDDQTAKLIKKSIKTLKDKKAELNADINNLNVEQKKVKIDLEANDPKLKLREKIIKELGIDPSKQEMTRGQIITLYLSLLREREMEERAAAGDNDIKPTRHLVFGSEIHLFDNEDLINKGYEYAVSNTKTMIIFANERDELIDYIESELLMQEDYTIMDFAKERFDINYNNLNEEYRKKNEVDLPRQDIYIPFSTVNSDYAREFKLKLAQRYNVGVADGMARQTTIGASTPLKIENIFGVLENSTRHVANYSFERIITDFQNLLVNNTSGSNLDLMLKGNDGVFGPSNPIHESIERAFVNILKYSEKTGKYEKLLKKGLRNSIGATMALNVKTMFNQFASISTIFIKNGGNIGDFMKNVTVSLGKSKYRRWLMNNNDNFYLRAKFGNIPYLAEQITPDVYKRTGNFFNKITDILSRHIGWADNTVLVGVFKSYADAIREENKKNRVVMSEERVLELANDRLQEVLLFGVANTDTAFRADLSNRDNIVYQLAAKFQSENIMQVSAILRRFVAYRNNRRNGKGGSLKELFKHFMAFFMSALITATVSTVFGRIRGTIKEDEVLFEGFVNELLWNNMVGAMPIINTFTSMIQFTETENGIWFEKGFDKGLPVLSEVAVFLDKVGSMSNGENIGKKAIDALAAVGNIFSIPVRNFKRLVTTTTKLFGDGGNGMAIEISQYLSASSNAQGLNTAIKEGNAKRIEYYSNLRFENYQINQEIVRLLSNNPDMKLNLYNVETFSAEDEKGNMVKYKIPSATQDKYKAISQRVVFRLIKSGKYMSLKDEEKIKAIQRVINYYYNHMKENIKNGGRDKVTMMSETDVINRSLSYAL
jgi:hypothetical protein